jgi:GR25 family glycosyltransferase involved in LPS biosynthesis
MEWNDVLNLPCFVLNMDRCIHRMDTILPRIRNAGFHDITRIRAVDAKHDDLHEAWRSHGSPNFHPKDPLFVEYKGKQGCALSHYNVWKMIIEKRIPYAVIFEDDVRFDDNWDVLAPALWLATPKDFDIMYMGSMMLGYDFRQTHHGTVADIRYETPAYLRTQPIVVRKPLFCTHAYIISYEGAKKLYDLCVHNPQGTWTIDNILMDYMVYWNINNNEEAFRWYVWNATCFHHTPIEQKATDGLVFQDTATFETNVDVVV